MSSFILFIGPLISFVPRWRTTASVSSHIYPFNRGIKCPILREETNREGEISSYLLIHRPDGSLVSTGMGLVTWRYQARIPVEPDICHRGCAYIVLQAVQRPGVYSAAYGTVHYQEPLKSFEIRVGHSLGFGLPSVGHSSGFGLPSVAILS